MNAILNTLKSRRLRGVMGDLIGTFCLCVIFYGAMLLPLILD